MTPCSTSTSTYLPETRALEQRYVQFSGIPGILLYGFRSEEQLGEYTAMTEPWGFRLKPSPFFPEDVEKEKNRKKERSEPSLRAGLGIHQHGKAGSAWYAR